MKKLIAISVIALMVTVGMGCRHMKKAEICPTCIEYKMLQVTGETKSKSTGAVSQEDFSILQVKIGKLP